MKFLKHFFYLAVYFTVSAGAVFAQTAEFTYQGKLDVTGMTSATYDFEFNLCNTEDCESVLDSNLKPGVAVSGGVFTVKLNFAPGEFNGADRFLQIRVKRPTETVYTTLEPSQKITSAPYSIQAATAANALKLGNVAANQFVLTTDPRLNAGNYVQNTTAPQPGVSFNIGGTGTANVFSAATQFNIGSDRILSVGGSSNLFVGRYAGGSNTGNTNTFIGDNAGRLNTTGNENTFVGGGVALFHTTGSNNVFLGSLAGAFNETGGGNIFIGKSAGNTSINTQVNNSVVIGTNATVSASNSLAIGANATVSASNSMAIGTNATVSTANTIVLGTTAETTRIPGLLNAGDLGGGNFNMRVVNTAAGGGVVAPNLYIRSFAQSASGFHLCWRAAGDGVAANVITNCISSFSSERYKDNSQPFSGGLNVIKRLKPTQFKWKSDGTQDIGLNAEAVAEVEPNLVTRNDKGEVEDVKETGLSALFINAFKEQQLQIETQKNLIETQQEQLEKQQQQIDALKKAVCAANREAEICQEKIK